MSCRACSGSGKVQDREWDLEDMVHGTSPVESMCYQCHGSGLSPAEMSKLTPLEAAVLEAGRSLADAEKDLEDLAAGRAKSGVPENMIVLLANEVLHWRRQNQQRMADFLKQLGRDQGP